VTVERSTVLLSGVNVCVRILHDHSSVAGVHSQALDTLQEKLNDAEASLRLEVEQHRKTKVNMLIYLSLMSAYNPVTSYEPCHWYANQHI